MYSQRIANAWQIRICGHDKSAPYGCERFAITWRTPTKWGANIPPGVGADSSRPYPNIIKYAYSRHKIRVSVSPHTHIHIINYVFLHHQIHISVSPHTHFRSPFRGCIHICGHDKSAPYSCWRFAVTLLTDCQNTNNTDTKTLPLCTTLLLPIL